MLHFLRVERALVLCNFLLYFSACGTRSGIVEFFVIFSACGMRSGIVECFVNVYVGGTRSGIVESCVIIFHVFKVLVEIIQLLFLHVCCIFRVVFFVEILNHFTL